MEYQILAEFLRLLKIGRNSRIEAYVLHYLSIMIQNMESDHAICKILHEPHTRRHIFVQLPT